MSRIYWDTMLFIYYFEGHSDFGPSVQHIHQEMTRRGDVLCTSVFTAGEILIGPQKRKAHENIKELKEYFESDEIELIPFTLSTAEAYSRIRAENSVLPADAIHLASASEARADLFFTNDKKIQKLNIPGISFIVGLDGKLW
jgi:predicted nucleic acid-binding protein